MRKQLFFSKSMDLGFANCGAQAELGKEGKFSMDREALASCHNPLGHKRVGHGLVTKTTKLVSDTVFLSIIDIHSSMLSNILANCPVLIISNDFCMSSSSGCDTKTPVGCSKRYTRMFYAVLFIKYPSKEYNLICIKGKMDNKRLLNTMG